MPRTLAQKIWDTHLVKRADGRDLLYTDLHLVHELSPQAFGGLDLRNLPVRRPERTLATMDHSVPTQERFRPIADLMVKAQLDALRNNCEKHGLPMYGLNSRGQGIVHVIGPETGLTQPGMTIGCGDSHTSTHGALGALAFGIGTSQVEQVLATQCLLMSPLKQMAVTVEGILPDGVFAKDLALSVVARVGFGGAQGKVIEFRGETIRNLSIEGRLTLCNMSAESGARTSIIAPDEATFAYVKGKQFAPSGTDWDAALEYWRTLYSDEDAPFDSEIVIDATSLEPTVTWGTTPAMSVPVSGRVPKPDETRDPDQTIRALAYMGLTGGEKVVEIEVDKVFIGSCTNSRIEDLRAAAAVVVGRRVAPRVRAIVVPGSMAVKASAEAEGLDQIFLDAGFEWRDSGCSMCIAMNDDRVEPNERCASTSNRNFEGRQGSRARTHLVSPQMAALTAIAGHFVDPRTVSPS